LRTRDRPISACRPPPHLRSRDRSSANGLASRRKTCTRLAKVGRLHVLCDRCAGVRFWSRGRARRRLRWLTAVAHVGPPRPPLV
jgi:hypothetical protein